MKVLEEALYDLGGCDGLVDQCVEGEGAERSFAPMSKLSVQKLHEKLKPVCIALDKRLVVLGIADGAPTVQNGWRACEIWNERGGACGGVKALRGGGTIDRDGQYKRESALRGRWLETSE